MKLSQILILRQISRSSGALWLFLCLQVLILSNTATGQVIAIFEDDHDFLITENGQYKSVFTIMAEKEVYNHIVTVAGKMAETLAFTSEKIKKNKYQCSILFTYPTDPYYVKKILLTLGIEQLKVNNKLFILPDYEPVVE
ncbi:MAG: hypothetical protein V1775_09700 [Bacteroidota bacterium]